MKRSHDSRDTARNRKIKNQNYFLGVHPHRGPVFSVSLLDKWKKWNSVCFQWVKMKDKSDHFFWQSITYFSRFQTSFSIFGTCSSQCAVVTRRKISKNNCWKLKKKKSLVSTIHFARCTLKNLQIFEKISKLLYDFVLVECHPAK